MSSARTVHLVVGFACGGALAAACAADPGDSPKNADSRVETLEGGGEPFQDGPTVGVDSPIELDQESPGEASSPDAPLVETSAPDAPPDVATCTGCKLMVDYMTTETSAMSSSIAPQFEIINNGAASQDMSVLTLRYYYTADGSTSQMFACDYAMVGCSVVQGTFVAMTTPTATADHYMEVSFTGGTIASGESSGDIQTRFYDTKYAVMFTQTNDYSFNAGDGGFTPSMQVTLYRSGALVWGVEPQ